MVGERFVTEHPSKPYGEFFPDSSAAERPVVIGMK